MSSIVREGVNGESFILLISATGSFNGTRYSTCTFYKQAIQRSLTATIVSINFFRMAGSYGLSINCLSKLAIGLFKVALTRTAFTTGSDGLTLFR